MKCFCLFVLLMFRLTKKKLFIKINNIDINIL